MICLFFLTFSALVHALERNNDPFYIHYPRFNVSLGNNYCKLNNLFSYIQSSYKFYTNNNSQFIWSFNHLLCFNGIAIFIHILDSALCWKKISNQSVENRTLFGEFLGFFLLLFICDNSICSTQQ